MSDPRGSHDLLRKNPAFGVGLEGLDMGEAVGQAF